MMPRNEVGEQAGPIEEFSEKRALELLKETPVASLDVFDLKKRIVLNLRQAKLKAGLMEWKAAGDLISETLEAAEILAREGG